MTKNDLKETEFSLFSEASSISGQLTLGGLTRFHGVIKGDILLKPGSTLIVSSSAKIEGNINGESIIVDGYVDGSIHATKSLHITHGARILGKIKAPELRIDYGAKIDADLNIKK